ncbi:MAG TPA: DUF3052 domain-containing protein [Caulobacteraceae bacterium]|jgi:hypothetical protein|nr:DUF3052 domain-containing protein [Caulobacteraceae bacterium]
MGKDAQVEAIWADGARDAGRLQYEPPRLIFRGAERRVFEGEALAGVIAEGAELVLASGARFRLPNPAASWADAIARPKGRLDKLGVKPGLRLGLANLDDPAFAAELPALAEGGDALDLLFYGADSEGDLAAIATLVPRLADRGALWIVSLKGKAARLKDTDVMAAAKSHGLVDTKVCAFSDTRTALKFVRRQ